MTFATWWLILSDTWSAEIFINRFIAWLQISSSKYYGWQKRYGEANEHNGAIPHNFWLEEWEEQAIVVFHHEYPLEGYRHLTFMWEAMTETNVEFVLQNAREKHPCVAPE